MRSSENAQNANFVEFYFHALRCISLQPMYLIPPGGIIRMVSTL
jgi:hypothetical protein